MKALVLGLGESGLAMARWLARAGRPLRVADTREAPPQLAALRAEIPDAEFVAGPFGTREAAEALLEGVTLVAPSPGLSPTHSDAKAVVTAARARRIEIAGEIELFAQALAHLRGESGYAPQLVGITGTNGKTTVTRLVGLLLERAGRDVEVAGNISPSALDALRARLDRQRDEGTALPDTWVLELSSFQLATTRSLACTVAAVLNVTQDHLDWHGSLDDYVKAKARIFAKDTIQVLNRDDPRVLALAGKRAQPVTFGLTPPKHADEYGLVREGGIPWLALAEDAEQGPRRRVRKAASAPAPDGGAEGAGPASQAAEAAGQEAAADTQVIVPPPVVEPPREVFVQRLMPADALRIRGRHNAANVLAALALARAVGAPLAPQLHALREYAGEPHRVQHVATIDGVEWYDDSKGTNVGATVAAIEGLGAEGRRLVVILGGDGKGQDFGPLVAPLAQYARAVVLIGRDGPRIGELLQGAAYPVGTAESMPAAVHVAAQYAHPGDAVLLSPACASLDMFRDYRQRAEAFVDAVRELAADRGQPC